MRINSKFKRCYHSKIQQILLATTRSLKFPLCSTQAKLIPSDLCFDPHFFPFLSHSSQQPNTDKHHKEPLVLARYFSAQKLFHFLLLAQSLPQIYARSLNMNNLGLLCKTPGKNWNALSTYKLLCSKSCWNISFQEFQSQLHVFARLSILRCVLCDIFFFTPAQNSMEC